MKMPQFTARLDDSLVAVLDEMIAEGTAFNRMHAIRRCIEFSAVAGREGRFSRLAELAPDRYVVPLMAPAEDDDSPEPDVLRHCPGCELEKHYGYFRKGARVCEVCEAQGRE